MNCLLYLLHTVTSKKMAKLIYLYHIKYSLYYAYKAGEGLKYDITFVFTSIEVDKLKFYQRSILKAYIVKLTKVFQHL